MGDYIVQKLKDIVHYETLDKRSIILLTHWGRATHICVSKLTIIGSDNVLSPDRCQAIIWTNAGLLLIGPLGTNFSEILIEIITFSLKKMRLKVSSAKRRPFCLGLNLLTEVSCQIIWLQGHDFLWFPPKTTIFYRQPTCHSNPAHHRQMISIQTSAYWGFDLEDSPWYIFTFYLLFGQVYLRVCLHNIFIYHLH